MIINNIETPQGAPCRSQKVREGYIHVYQRKSRKKDEKQQNMEKEE